MIRAPRKSRRKYAQRRLLPRANLQFAPQWNAGFLPASDAKFSHAQALRRRIAPDDPLSDQQDSIAALPASSE
ncbi:hypothetical protein D3C85_1745230 [compost metagenome]